MPRSLRVVRPLALLAALVLCAASGSPPSSAAPTSSAAEVAAKMTTLVTIPAVFEVKAPIAKVWAAASSVEGFCAITGFVPDPGAPTKRFAAIGDAVPASVWTDRGMLVATYVAEEKELRVTWEVASGAYLCGKRLVLSPTAAGTRVEYWDRYTDDQANVDETAAAVVKDTVAGIAKFTALAEK